MQKTILHKDRFPFFLLVLMILLVGVFFFSRAQQSEHRKQNRSNSSVNANQELQKFDLVGFDDQGKKFWNLQGDAAKIETGQTVLLEDNVTLKLKDGSVVKTDHVRWSQELGQMRTNSPVLVDRGTTQIRGKGAFGKLNESFIQINRDIDMVISPTAHLTCLGPMKIFYNQNKMVFYRRVRVTDDKGVLTANQMDVFFDPEDRKAKEIIAIGNVVITRGTDTSRSERAIYTPSTGSVRLEGSPEITWHKNSSDLLHGPIAN